MGFQGHLNQEQAFQVYIRGLLDFGAPYPAIHPGDKMHWWKTIFWRYPAFFPEVPHLFPAVLTHFLPHESGAPLGPILHPLDWEMALIRAAAASYPLPEQLVHASLSPLKSGLTAFQKDTLERAQLAGAHFLEFRKYREAKKFAHAEDQLRLAIEQYPEAAVLKVHGAWLYLLKGHVEKALLAIEDLPLLYPAPALQMAVKIGSLTRLGHAQQALDFWEQSAFPFPVTPELALTLSLAYANMEKKDAARLWLERAACQDFPPEGFFWLKARMDEKEGNHDQGLSIVVQAEKNKDLAWFAHGNI